MAQLEERDPGAAPASRRGVLGIVAGIAAALGGMIGLPVGGLFAAPLFRKATGGDWVPLGAAEEFGEDRQEVVKTFVQKDGWYRATRTLRVVVGKSSPSDFTVLSTICTHVGCGVTWKPEEKIFFCPCHDGEFNADGTVKKGPPTKPLAKLDWRVNEQTKQLEVREV